MYPAVLLRKRTPTSTAELSATETVAGVAVAAQIEHGHPVPPGAAVPKVHVYGAITFPAASRAPVMVAVDVVDAASAPAGVSVSVREAASYAVAPAPGPPAAVTARAAVPLCSGSVKVAATV